MILSITGSREGMTPQQRRALVVLIHVWGVTAIVHGDCIGVDAEADEVARGYGLARFAYPSNFTATRARCDRRGCEYRSEPRPPTVRNLDIVGDGDITVAFPRPSSRGTWDAVRKARRLGRCTVVVDEMGCAS